MVGMINKFITDKTKKYLVYKKLTILFKLWTNKNHSYKHNEQINNQNIDSSECFGVKFVKIYPEMTSQYFLNQASHILQIQSSSLNAYTFLTKV
jgi:hypothetical protein